MRALREGEESIGDATTHQPQSPAEEPSGNSFFLFLSFLFLRSSKSMLNPSVVVEVARARGAWRVTHLKFLTGGDFTLWHLVWLHSRVVCVVMDCVYGGSGHVTWETFSPFISNTMALNSGTSAMYVCVCVCVCVRVWTRFVYLQPFKNSQCVEWGKY